MEVQGRRSLKGSVKINQDINLCQICQCDGTDVHAHGFCKTCEIYLCTTCLNFHHTIEQNREHMILYKQCLTNNNVQDGSCSSFCGIHVTEKVKLYCQKHDFVGCVNCMNISHGFCLVQAITDVSRNYGNSKELDTIKEEMINLMDEVVSSKQEIVSSLNNAKEIKENQIVKVKTFHAEMKEYLKAAEEEILREVEQLHTKNVSPHKQLYDSCEVMETELNNYLQQLNQNTLESDNLFANVKLAKKKVCALQDSPDFVAIKAKPNMCNTFQFQPSSELMTLKRNLAPLGTLHVQEKENSKESSDCENNLACNFNEVPVFVDKINVKVEIDEDCWITGMTIISGDEILLADNANNSLKILDINECKVTSMCKMYGKPLDVTTIKPGTAAATLPDKGEIILMNTNNGLTQDSTLKVRKNCRGIDHKNGLLAVTFSSPPTVQILNLNGEILHALQDRQILRYPCSVAFTTDNTELYVSDFVGNKVYKLKLTDKLTVNSKFEDLKRPSGLTLTKDNNLIVCCTGDSEHISVINSGENHRQSLYTEHVQRPVSVVISLGQNYMCIGENKGADDSDFIKVYYLKQ